MRISDWSSDVCSSDLSRIKTSFNARGRSVGLLPRSDIVRNGSVGLLPRSDIVRNGSGGREEARREMRGDGFVRDRVMRRAWMLGTALAAVALATPAAAAPMVTTVAHEAGTSAPDAGEGLQPYLFGEEIGKAAWWERVWK